MFLVMEVGEWRDVEVMVLRDMSSVFLSSDIDRYHRLPRGGEVDLQESRKLCCLQDETVQRGVPGEG